MRRMTAASFGSWERSSRPAAVGAALDLLVDPLERVGAGDLRPVLPGAVRAGEDVLAGGVHQRTELVVSFTPAHRRPSRALIRPAKRRRAGARQGSHWAKASALVSCAKIVRIMAATAARCLGAARARRLRVHRQQGCRSMPIGAKRRSVPSRPAGRPAGGKAEPRSDHSRTGDEVAGRGTAVIRSPRAQFGMASSIRPAHVSRRQRRCRPLAVPVAVVDPLGAAHAGSGARERAGSGRHQPLTGEGKEPAHQIRIDTLPDQLELRHPRVGHRRQGRLPVTAGRSPAGG